MRTFIDWCGASRRAGAKFLPLVFLLCALPTGISVALLTPIGGVSDEPEHISRADGLLTGQMIGISRAGSATAGVSMNAALFAAIIAENQTLNLPLPDAARAQARSVRWSDHRFGAGKIFCITQMVRYFPAFYLPGALGIAAGQSLRITPLHSLFLGRGFMLLSFLLMGAAALQVARFGRPLLFTMLSLPMTLNLAGSFNQDGQMIAAAALAAALLTRPRPGPNWQWLLALLLLTLIACAKAPYVWLLLCLLPPERRGFGKRLGLVAAAAALPVLWLWAARRASAWPWGRPPYHPGPLWPGARGVWLTTTSARGNIEVLLAHPLRVFWLLLSSSITQAPLLGQQLIGVLGWEAIPLPAWQYAGWALALAASVASLVLAGPGQAAARMRGFYLLVLLATALSIALSAYVTFTDLGDTTIDGLRGRYFLPVLPFLLFVLPLGWSWRDPPAAWRAGLAALFLPALAMAAADIYLLPAQIFQAFRMAGP